MKNNRSKKEKRRKGGIMEKGKGRYKYKGIRERERERAAMSLR